MTDFEDGDYDELLSVQPIDEFGGDERFREVLRGERDCGETRRVVTELDSEWFRMNPHVGIRVREYVPGEFDNDSGGFCGDPDGLVVVVTRPGDRQIVRVGSFGARRGWNLGGVW